MESTILTQVVVPVCLFLIMFGMGLSLTVNDFSRVLRFPKPIILGLAGQLLLLPAVGFLIASYMITSPPLAIGIMLIAACPGGTTSNMVSYLAKGDVALSISLTAISSVITIITIPVILLYSMNHFLGNSELIDLPVSRIVLVLFVITILPVFIGMLVKRFKAPLAEKLEPKINVFSGLFLITLIVLVLNNQGDVVFGTLSEVWYASLALNVITMCLAAAMAILARLNSAQTVSLSVEVGIQNSTLAILLATTILGLPEVAIPAAVYTLLMYFTGTLLIFSRRVSGARALPKD
jgi:BASS family bile acid:Na+ symporter